jgi:hypothetical protein
MSKLGRKLDFPDNEVFVVVSEGEWLDEHGNSIETLTLIKVPVHFSVKRGPNQWQMVKELSAPQPLTKGNKMENTGDYSKTNSKE